MNEEHKGKIDPRIPRIVELVKQGKNWTQISKETGIPRRSLYNIRHSEGFMQVAEDIWLQIWEDIKTLREIGGNFTLDQAIKHQIKMFSFMAGTTLDGLMSSNMKPTECNDECPLYATATTEKRKAKDFFFKKVIQVQPWQWERIELHVKGLPYEHVTPDWIPPAPVIEY